ARSPRRGAVPCRRGGDLRLAGGEGPQPDPAGEPVTRRRGHALPLLRVGAAPRAVAQRSAGPGLCRPPRRAGAQRQPRGTNDNYDQHRRLSTGGRRGLRAVTHKGRDMVLIYTTAPTDYDGFSTKTVNEHVGDDGGKAVRLVELEERDENWQRS